MQVVHKFVSSIPADWSYLTFVIIDTMLYTLFIEDVVFSVIAALELRERLGKTGEKFRGDTEPAAFHRRAL